MEKHFGESVEIKPEIMENKMNYVGTSINLTTEQSKSFMSNKSQMLAEKRKRSRSNSSIFDHLYNSDLKGKINAEQTRKLHEMQDVAAMASREQNQKQKNE